MHSSNFLSTCIANAVVNYLLFQSPLFKKYYNTGLMFVSSEVSWWEIDIQVAHCWHWQIWNQILNTQDCPMQSTGNCALVVWRGALPIEIWTTDRQTGWKVRYLCQSRPEWQQPVLSNELHCVCCVQWKFTLNQLTDRIKLLLVVPQMKVNNLERNIQCTSLSWNYISHVFLGPMVDFWTWCNNLIS